ncbi:peptidoglycan bridge formation glycyltransferase FemA/FemB family protein [Pseudonocardia sp. RS11V-5]|uniref:lipid II:glycine glycyltransferase FemX n=1 Tax=Pseudonocardia terrae TaxID=2905831 RepID=UPI001E50633F|nr:peptidoglycan bridge formation glycyltransferase FemA/FemB family protein [Pseudonocardia terrae]MCE3553470.1 peptidoglycan bridge formation glycyltransferase FemA/FemB family protein [Pseudonocardia terrae]
MKVAGSYRVHVVAPGDDGASEWDAFLATVSRAPYQQSFAWAVLKATQGWRAASMTLTRDGSIHGGAQLLYRSIPFVGAVGFVARGPILASNDPLLVAAAADGLRLLAATCGVTYLVVQPPRRYIDDVSPRLAQDGYRTAPEIMAPLNTTTCVLDLSRGTEAILTSMRKSTRRSIRLAQQRGASVRDGGAADLPIFHSLLAATARRRGFSPPPASFFRAAWDTMAPSRMLRLAVAEVDGEPVSAFLWVVFGDTMNCWRGGWSGEHPRRRPNEALDWVGIRWAAAQGLRWYDFQGDADYTRGFGGCRLTSPGPLERVMSPLLRRLYPPVIHHVLDTRGISRLKQVVRSRGWPGSTK